MSGLVFEAQKIDRCFPEKKTQSTSMHTLTLTVPSSLPKTHFLTGRLFFSKAGMEGKPTHIPGINIIINLGSTYPTQSWQMKAYVVREVFGIPDILLKKVRLVILVVTLAAFASRSQKVVWRGVNPWNAALQADAIQPATGQSEAHLSNDKKGPRKVV